MKNVSYIPPKALLIMALIGISLSLLAQDSLQIVMGTVRNSSNYEPISFALVKNEMLRTKIISDEQGQYIIPINRGDLLKITAIGFEDGFYIVNDSSSIINNFPIQLRPKVYELKEFTLTPYKTVLQFKKAVLDLKLPESDSTIALNLPKPIPIPSQLTERIPEVTFITIKGPFTNLYNQFSHRGKMMKKHDKLISKDKENTAIYKRLDFDFVSSIVPIETGEELDAFMEYCQFDFSFLLNASDYELIAAVQKKYMAYLLTKIP